jgi:hypothetical protein
MSVARPESTDINLLTNDDSPQEDAAPAQERHSVPLSRNCDLIGHSGFLVRNIGDFAAGVAAENHDHAAGLLLSAAPIRKRKGS